MIEVYLNSLNQNQFRWKGNNQKKEVFQQLVNC